MERCEMKRTSGAPSLRRQMGSIILLCWLLPMLFGTVMLGYYVFFGSRQQREDNMIQQFNINLQMGADRVKSAVEASRLPSYDPELREAWNQYESLGSYPLLYRRYSTLFGRIYRMDSRFDYVVFSFASERDSQQAIAVVSGGSGADTADATRVWSCWREDGGAVLALADELDTAVGFIKQGERIYLVRNLLDSSYKQIGVLAMALDKEYYFGDRALLDWASAVSISLGDELVLNVRGDHEAEPGQYSISSSVQSRDFTLRGTAEISRKSLYSGMEGYFAMLVILVSSLLLLMVFTFRFFRRRISEPIQELMAGSERIQQGELGSQIVRHSDSAEFQYLTDSFNQMSARLRDQFDRLYQGELLLRNAEVRALQAHINPHFLNNTLEIINWEARMNGDAKVSKMVEALSTVMDAALDRKGKPEVRLSEEMTYVNAYLYIVAQRFGSRMAVNVDLPDELMEYMVPRLIMQPVIENAVEHGVGASGQGRVNIRGFCQGDKLIIEIENDGGMQPRDEERIARLLSMSRADIHEESSGNIGIANVNLRLKILYGDECSLSIARGEGKLVIARLTIALHK